MKKVVILLLILFMCSCVYSAEYNLIVLPTNFLQKDSGDLLNINTEELLAKKIINQLTVTDLAVIPKLKFVKEHMENHGEEPNIKSLMVFFNVKNVIVITSKVEVQNPTDEKKFWSNLKLPMLTGNSNTLRVITTVKLVNCDRTIWENTYLKNINILEDNLDYYNKHISKIEIFNDYYENLAISIIKEIQEFDKTVFKSKRNFNFNPEQLKNEQKNKKFDKKYELEDEHKNIHQDSHNNNLTPTDFNMNLKPNLEMKEENKTQPKEKFIDKIKNSVKLKN